MGEYFIGAIGPNADGDFFNYDGDPLEFSNFENETSARSGDFGFVYIDFPNNWWKVAPLMEHRKMRYICSAFNACYNHPCGDAGGAQCLFNSTSGSFYCEYNVTSCDEGVKCQHCGTCVDQADGYSCQCGEHYIGRHCGVYDYCWSNPCQNGATCSSSGFGFFFSYYCLCANNFYGDWCQYKTSTCHVTTCPSGMQCIESDQSAFCVAEDRLGTAKCVSSTIAGEWLTESMFTSNFVNQLSQYVRPYVSINGSIACGCDDVTSDACEYDVNECASDPCLNGDTCLD